MAPRHRISRARNAPHRRSLTAAIVVFYVVATLVARRRGFEGLGARTVVRCREGHLFRTMWVPGVSVTSLRLGWYRFQFCPVGRHWTLVKPVRDRDVLDEGTPLESLAVDIALP